MISRDDPQLMLQQATDELLAISKAARAYVDQDQERYYAEVSAVVDQIMDINYFARGVMATYASAGVYKSLQTEAEKSGLSRSGCAVCGGAQARVDGQVCRCPAQGRRRNH
ncbi:MAG: hypothetical protein MZW92_34525 [Comamonadaceae bacterium]|nr:hypothetical protein [Comamonadaceae bacterium]